MSITVTVFDRDGNPSTRTLAEGTKLGSVVDLGRDAVLLEGKQVPAGQNPELRDGDEIEYVRKSQKPGA